jgi:predicted AAA+ superfamily ATPase
MPESPYRVLGVDIPALMGRAKLSAQLWDRLMKPTPDHVAVVGPRHYGKTVLLKHLADTFPQTQTGYIASV